MNAKIKRITFITSTLLIFSIIAGVGGYYYNIERIDKLQREGIAVNMPLITEKVKIFKRDMESYVNESKEFPLINFFFGLSEQPVVLPEFNKLVYNETTNSGVTVSSVENRALGNYQLYFHGNGLSYGKVTLSAIFADGKIQEWRCIAIPPLKDYFYLDLNNIENPLTFIGDRRVAADYIKQETAELIITSFIENIQDICDTENNAIMSFIH